MYNRQLHGGDNREYQLTAPGTVVGTTGTPARYLINTTNTAWQGVAYSLYSDSGFNNVVANNAALPIASTAGGVDSYTYGRITGGGNSVMVVLGPTPTP